MLFLAQEVGLEVPGFIITKSKGNLLKRFRQNEYNNYITKAISEGLYFFGKTRAFYQYTEKITESEINKLQDNFFPSLFQNEIEKKFELRIFFLEGTFFSMAILSQNIEEASVDYRKANSSEKVIRKIPYNLPIDVENKLTELFKLLNLNTGSVDMIVDKDDKFIFLEINPVGQFSMVSYPCNYYLEKEVAKLLLSEAV